MQWNPRIVLVIVLAAVSCVQAEPRQLNLYPSATAQPTVSPIVIQITTTPVATQTAQIVVVSATPNTPEFFCVSAATAVHLRPSASAENYPIMVIPNGAEVADLGGRSGDWMFVELADRKGWVHGTYVEEC